MKNKEKYQGFGLLEIIIGVAVISGSMFALMSVSNMAFRLMQENMKNVQSSFLLEEGIESLKVLRDSSWSNNIETLSVDTDYYSNFSGGDWRTTSSNIYIDGIFERKFILQNVYRDINDDIVESEENLDSDARKLTVFVSWPTPNGTSTRSISTYITNLFNN